jgi:CubicO group peptidase (beta-lactamase class C family)
MTGLDVMNAMFKRAASALAGLLGLAAAGAAGAAPLPVAKPEAAGFSAERLRRLDETMRALVDQGQIAGGVTVLGRHGRIVSLKAFGKRSLETGDAMPADTIFRIRSETKPVTGVAMMMLYEEGLLVAGRSGDQVRAPVRRPAAWPPASTPRAARAGARQPAATMRELMTHTAGFAYGLAEDASPADTAYLPGRGAAVRQPAGDGRSQGGHAAAVQPARRALALQRRHRHPGLHRREAVGHEPAVFMEDPHLPAAGMVDTGFWVPAEKLPRLADPV